MQALKQLAEALGFDVLCGKASLYQIKDINYPCLLHWNQNHFVVLYKVKRTDSTLQTLQRACKIRPRSI